MILVEIYVPSIDETCDFELDENVKIRLLTEEIAEMLSKRTGGHREAGDEPFLLCFAAGERVLSGDSTLYQSGVRDGSRLLLL